MVGGGYFVLVSFKLGALCLISICVFFWDDGGYGRCHHGTRLWVGLWENGY